jgi:hypothetical protein
MASCEPMFDLENRLMDDECALADRTRQSEELSEYLLSSFYSSNVPACDTEVAKVAACHNNLRFRDGYGNANACVIDADSSARLGAKQTNSPHRQQLASRVFHGHPHFWRGAVQPEEEASLIQSDITREKKPCKGDIPADRFVPLLPCIQEAVQNPKTAMVSDWQWGGEDSRSWVRDSDYLEKCGYSNDGRMWKKN